MHIVADIPCNGNISIPLCARMGGSIRTPIVIVFSLLSAPISIIGGTLSALRPRPLPIHAAGRRGDGCDRRLDEVVQVCNLTFKDIHSHTGECILVPWTCPDNEIERERKSFNKF